MDATRNQSLKKASISRAPILVYHRNANASLQILNHFDDFFKTECEFVLFRQEKTSLPFIISYLVDPVKPDLCDPPLLSDHVVSHVVAFFSHFQYHAWGHAFPIHEELHVLRIEQCLISRFFRMIPHASRTWRFESKRYRDILIFLKSPLLSRKLQTPSAVQRD